MKHTYCTNCRKETTYTLKKQEIRKVIKDKEYTFLITVAVCNECGEEISLPGLLDLNIKETIKEVINNEDKIKPLSDQKITTLLKDKGIEISRRTVAKYRSELNIPDASGRKHIKK